MAHHTVRQGYRDLVERINRFPQGAPPSEILYQILALLFSEREAELVAELPTLRIVRLCRCSIWQRASVEQCEEGHPARRR